MMPNFQSYVNKTVDFRWSGVSMAFHLSHGLFSSFGIDEGTRLLLKSIADRIDPTLIGSILDIGCGVGVMGISLKKKAPGASVLLQDRDALAVEFARENCRANGIDDASLDCGLAFQHMEGRTFDLVISNLPAKAGLPVLESFFRALPHHLTAKGLAVVVIVAPLADFALSTVRSLGLEIIHADRTKDYCVMHLRASSQGNAPQAASPHLAAPHVAAPGDDMLLPYLRARSRFACQGVSWELSAAWSLPDFDSLGWQLQLALELLSRRPAGGRALVWNPGQGHLPAFLCARAARAADAASAPAAVGITIAGRDALELAITGWNLARQACPPTRTLTLPSEAAMIESIAPESFDLICAVPHPIPRVAWQGEMLEAARHALVPGGVLCLSSTSTEMFRFIEEHRGFRLLQSKKQSGFRAALLERL
jgi:SAM-dependent methyltransferase